MLRDLLDFLPEAIICLDHDDRLVLWNKQYAELYPEIAGLLRPGVRFDELLRASLASGRYPEDVDDPNLWLQRRLAERVERQGTMEHSFRDGRWIRHEERRTRGGGSVAVKIDITDLKHREDSFRLLFANNPVPMWLCDPQTRRIIEVNEAAVDLYGYAQARFLTMTDRDLIAPVQSSALSGGGQPESQMVCHRVADGRIIDVQTFERHLTGAFGPAYLVTVFDVTQRVRAESRIAHLAKHDDLTGLPNRSYLREKLTRRLERAAPDGTVAVLCLDLDHFKVVNDTLGHPTGDLLLQAVTARLLAIGGEACTIARLGGDEFVVLQSDGTQPADAKALAEQLIEEIIRPYDIDGHNIVIGLSIGIALSPQDGRDAETLIRNADTALYRAKEDGRRNCRFFEYEMDARLQSRRALELDLSAALALGQLDLFYQPLVNLENDRVCCFEALMRWRHPERGMVPPDEFIPLAERTGLILSLSEWALRRACEDAVAWPTSIRVAVNISPVQFKTLGLVQTVTAALAASGLSPERLELEVTETLLLQNNEQTLSILYQLRALGITIALDDFGTGYSSLTYLRQFPFHKIKIDRTFVRDIIDRDDCAAIVRAVVSLGSGLGMVTTAEGVETLAHLDQLREQGCTEVQGYFFSPPRPRHELRPWLSGPASKVVEYDLAADAAAV